MQRRAAHTRRQHSSIAQRADGADMSKLEDITGRATQLASQLGEGLKDQFDPLAR